MVRIKNIMLFVNLLDECRGTILYKEYKFDKIDKEVAEIEKLKLQDVLDFFDT